MKNRSVDISIDQLNVKVSGLSRAEGRQLAHHIGQGLRSRELQLPESGRARSINISKIPIRIERRAGQSVLSLSEQVISQFITALGKSIVPRGGQ